MTLAIITLSPQGLVLARHLAAQQPGSRIFVHSSVPIPFSEVCANPDLTVFGSILAVTAELFTEFRQLVYIAPLGVIVRALAPVVRHKLTDPAVVGVEVGGRWAVSLLSGHEGGANDLALTIGNLLNAEPIISTTTEALKSLIVGVGCRRDTAASDIIQAIRQTLEDAQLGLEEVRLLSTVDVKAREPGIQAAAAELQLPLRIIAADDIRHSPISFNSSDLVQRQFKLPGVAEPCALLAGRRTRLIHPKRKFPRVTIALARENCIW